ncbi:hypothetical protein, partial [Aeromonas hydrophila]|uniref:hypothetical protein n=1 Tax=Aeromonas hydrophila TaxID=644 RepID=UPI0036DA1DDC
PPPPQTHPAPLDADKSLVGSEMCIRDRGWTMAAGSGQLLCDLISGSDTASSDEGLTLARYG